MEESSMLIVDNIYAGYGASEVLDGASLEVKAGTLVALIGPNGAGKTTTMRAISGIVKPTKGRVLLDKKPVQGMDASHIARLGLAHVPEGRRVFAPMSGLRAVRDAADRRVLAPLYLQELVYRMLQLFY